MTAIANCLEKKKKFFLKKENEINDFKTNENITYISQFVINYEGDTYTYTLYDVFSK